MKQVAFLGDSLEAIRSFPGGARRDIGFQIDGVQHGLDPDHWKPMKTVGAGVREIRVNDPAGAFRAIYVAILADAVCAFMPFKRRHRRPANAIWKLQRSGTRNWFGG